MATYVKVMLGLPLSSASRNKHELSAAYEAGYRVVVFCGEGGFPEEEELSRYKIICRGALRAKGKNKLVLWRNLLREWIRFRRELKAEHPDVISCHNMSNLVPVWAVTRFMFPHPKLIYDCHEFTLDEAYSNRTEEERAKLAKREKKLMSRCAFSIMVNDSIAEEVQKAYSLPEKPVVIRSTPKCWTLDEALIAEKRRMMLEKLGVGEDTFLVLYHGNINRKRGTDSLIRALGMNPNFCAVFLGKGNTQELLEQANNESVSDRVLLLPPVPVETLWQYVGACNAGVSILHNTCLNHYYSLPNKFFETVQSMTPLICSDFPEMSRLVRQYGIGLLCDSEDPATLNDCIEKLRTDKELYASCKQNLLRAKEDLCWEKEKNVLLEAYRQYL